MGPSFFVVKREGRVGGWKKYFNGSKAMNPPRPPSHSSPGSSVSDFNLQRFLIFQTINHSRERGGKCWWRGTEACQSGLYKARRKERQVCLPLRRPWWRRRKECNGVGDGYPDEVQSRPTKMPGLLMKCTPSNLVT